VIYLANTGNLITFPDHTESQLETLTSGLIALLPKHLAQMRAHTKLNIGTKGVNQVTIQEENDPTILINTPSRLATSRVTTINPSDNYEIEVGDEMPALESDNESEEDSDNETFIPKEGNWTQLTGREPPTTRNVSSINMGRISRGPLQRLAAARHKLRRDGQLYSLLYE
jgi:hypothetical protein